MIREKAITAAMLGAMCAGTALGDGLTQVHPGYEMADIQPMGKRFLVGGLDFFSDGTMAVCNWGNPGEVWTVKGAETGDRANVQAQRYAYGMQQVLGCKVVRDTLYVMQMGELTQLVDTDKDGKADRYNRINDAFATSESLLGYAFDLIHHGGSFYATLAADVGWQGMTFEPPLADRSAWIRMGRDNSVEYLAAGFRNPNGMGLGFGNRMFAVDNQGSWLPSSKIIHLEKGRFYGHRTTPPNRFQDQPETPPMAWLPHAEVSYTPGNVVYLSEGLFKNQLLLAEQDKRLKGRIYRVSVQDVGGVLQGAVLPFSGGVGTGVCRVSLGKGNVLYAGNLGADGNWYGLSTMDPGLKRLRPRDAGKSFAFEMLAVRSMGPTKVEIEFTSAPAADAADPAKYVAEAWEFIPELAYGGGNKKNLVKLAVQAAVLKPDGKTVELTIAGLQEKRLLHIKLAGLLSAEGQAPWGSETWFTLNKFGPGKIPDVAGCRDRANPAYDPAAVVDDPSACIPLGIRGAAAEAGYPILLSGRDEVRIDLPAARDYVLGLYSLRGELLHEWRGRGQGSFQAPASLRTAGITLLRLRSGTMAWSRIWSAHP